MNLSQNYFPALLTGKFAITPSPLAGGRLGWGLSFSHSRDFTPTLALPLKREGI